MGRMHSKGKGISRSCLPYTRAVPAWVKTTPEEVKELIVKMARKGLLPSQIGNILRDSHSVGKTSRLTGTTIARILRAAGMAADIPEDLFCLSKKSISMRKHLLANRKDKDTKYRLILNDSRLHRLARYYRKFGQIPPNWKFKPAISASSSA